MPPGVPPGCAFTASPGGLVVRIFVMVAFACWAAWVFTCVVANIRRSHQATTVKGTLLAVAKAVGWVYMAVLPMGVAAVVEHRDLLALLDPSKQAWALDFGDLGLVPFTAALCVPIWQRLPQSGWHNSRLWPWLAAGGGIVLAVLFRIHESGAYDPWRYWSPGKLAHDEDNYPVFAAMVFFALFTIAVVFLTARSDWRTVALALMLAAVLAAFFVLLKHDYTGLDATQLHVQIFWGPLPHRVICST